MYAKHALRVCFPAESTLKELFTELQLCLHFLKLGPILAP